MNIKVVKLVTGEDVICEYKEKDENYVIMEDPVIIMTVPTEEGIGISMALPWGMISDKREFEIRKDHIIYEIDPPEELSNQYSSQFGSGIITARDIPDIPTIQI